MLSSTESDGLLTFDPKPPFLATTPEFSQAARSIPSLQTPPRPVRFAFGGSQDLVFIAVVGVVLSTFPITAHRIGGTVWQQLLTCVPLLVELIIVRVKLRRHRRIISHGVGTLGIVTNFKDGYQWGWYFEYAYPDAAGVWRKGAWARQRHPATRQPVVGEPLWVFFDPAQPEKPLPERACYFVLRESSRAVSASQRMPPA